MVHFYAVCTVGYSIFRIVDSRAITSIPVKEILVSPLMYRTVYNNLPTLDTKMQNLYLNRNKAIHTIS